MNLNRRAREFYALEITTVPPVAGPWEASFDRGATWEVATDVDGVPSWLVAGPDAAPGEAVHVVTTAVTPLVRAVENPEVVVRNAPRIQLAQ